MIRQRAQRSRGVAVATATGLVAAAGAAAMVLSTPPAPATVTAAPALAAFHVPSDDDDHGRRWDGHRERGDGWDGHPWRWWHDSGIRPELCFHGGGHVVWPRHRCEGGRFDDFHVR